MTAAVAPQTQSRGRSFGFGLTSLIVGGLGVVFALIPLFALAAVIHGSLALGFGLPAVTKSEGARMGILGALFGAISIGLGTWALVAA